MQNIEREGERDGGREGEIVTEACARVRETESEREREREREKRERDPGSYATRTTKLSLFTCNFL